ncbi:hypothetical protein C0J52_19274 [Blattella germanica]|nr:hypothetical protein C0J52_19274 [Blattella germanica]
MMTIEQWFLQFKRKSFSMDDDHRQGRPIEISTSENVAVVKKSIKEHKRIIYRQLEKLLKILVSDFHVFGEPVQLGLAKVLRRNVKTEVLFSNGYCNKMEKKIRKWCRKLIPGRSSLSNTIGQSSKKDSDFSANSQINFSYPEVLDNMEKEVPIEDQMFEIEQNIEACTQELDKSKYNILERQTCNSPTKVEHNFNEKIMHETGDFKCDGPNALLSVPLKSLTSGTENVDVVGLNVKQWEVKYSTSETCSNVKKCRDIVLACQDCETEFCDRSQSDMCIFSGLSKEEIILIRNEVEVQLNRMCPISFYDFCVIACDIDYEDALLFRTNFCKQYNLKGCMLFDPDISSLGGDIFEQYQAMIERSTKVFFYHTENYKKDYVHLRIQNGAVYQQLWEQMQRNREKCVPIFPHGRHKIGLALSGVSGLDASIPDSFRHRVNATFTENVRNIRMLKQLDAEKKRPVLYKEALRIIIQNHKRDIFARKKLLKSDHMLQKKKEKHRSKTAKGKLVERRSKRLPSVQSNHCDTADESVGLELGISIENIKALEERIFEEKIDLNDMCIYKLVSEEECVVCPIQRKEQYDFCMICSERDITKAEMLTNDLSKQFELIGHFIWNSIYAGSDQFSALEDVIDRSSVVVYYITQNFADDQFCCHIARNRLTQPSEVDDVIRNIPLLIQQDTLLPETLRLIQKLTLDYIGTQFPRIFSKTIRLKRIRRWISNEVQIHVYNRRTEG